MGQRCRPGIPWASTWLRRESTSHSPKRLLLYKAWDWPAENVLAIDVVDLAHPLMPTSAHRSALQRSPARRWWGWSAHPVFASFGDTLQERNEQHTQKEADRPRPSHERRRKAPVWGVWKKKWCATRGRCHFASLVDGSAFLVSPPLFRSALYSRQASPLLPLHSVRCAGWRKEAHQMAQTTTRFFHFAHGSKGAEE